MKSREALPVGGKTLDLVAMTTYYNVRRGIIYYGYLTIACKCIGSGNVNRRAGASCTNIGCSIRDRFNGLD